MGPAQVGISSVTQLAGLAALEAPLENGGVHSSGYLGNLAETLGYTEYSAVEALFRGLCSCRSEGRRSDFCCM